MKDERKKIEAIEQKIELLAAKQLEQEIAEDQQQQTFHYRWLAARPR